MGMVEIFLNLVNQRKIEKLLVPNFWVGQVVGQEEGYQILDFRLKILGLGCGERVWVC
jgi:hypothetical protein